MRSYLTYRARLTCAFGAAAMASATLALLVVTPADLEAERRVPALVAADAARAGDRTPVRADAAARAHHRSTRFASPAT